MSRMATVRTPKKENTMVRRKKPPKLLEERPMCITMDHSTSDSSEQQEEKISVLQCIIFMVKIIYKSYMGNGTYEHEQDSGPKVSGRKQCWRCS